MPEIIINAEQPKLFSTIPDVRCKIQAPGRLLVPDIPPGYYDMSDPMSHLGLNLELIKTLSGSWLLKDTSWSSFVNEPTTSSATSIKAAVALDTFVADLNNYEYILHWNTDVTVAHKEGVEKKNIPVRALNVYDHVIVRYPYNVTNLTNKEYTRNKAYTTAMPIHVYYGGTKNTLTMAWNNSYGIYAAPTAPTYSSATTMTPTVTINSPSVNARANSTAMSTANVTSGNIDPDLTTIKYVIKLYRCDRQTNFLSKNQRELINLYSSPL